MALTLAKDEDLARAVCIPVFYYPHLCREIKSALRWNEVDKNTDGYVVARF